MAKKCIAFEIMPICQLRTDRLCLSMHNALFEFGVSILIQKVIFVAFACIRIILYICVFGHRVIGTKYFCVLASVLQIRRKYTFTPSKKTLHWQKASKWTDPDIKICNNVITHNIEIVLKENLRFYINHSFVVHDLPNRRDHF